MRKGITPPTTNQISDTTISVISTSDAMIDLTFLQSSVLTCKYDDLSRKLSITGSFRNNTDTYEYEQLYEKAQLEPAYGLRSETI